MTANGEEAVELFLVDCGIENLLNVYLDLPRLEILNMHSNYIGKMVNLDRLVHLKVLDLSSNRIAKMEGLEHLRCLQHLNLACNEIAVLDGISALTALLILNLSYNAVKDISNLSAMATAAHQLQLVELQGNQLSDLRHITDSVRYCRTLRYLILEDSAADNPVCQARDYRKVIRAAASSIISLNKNDIPEEILFATTVHQEPSSGKEAAKVHVDVHTPCIDFVLQQRRAAIAQAPTRERPAVISASADSPGTSTSCDDTVTAEEGKPHTRTASRERDLRKKLDQLEKELLAGRLDRLERQLALIATQSKPDFSDSEGCKDGSGGGSSTSTTEPQEETCSRREGTCSRRARAVRHLPEKTPELGIPGIRKLQASDSKIRQPRKQASRSAVSGPASSASSTTTTTAATAAAAAAAAATGAVADAANREAVSETYTQLLSDLAKERERRWKAEEAAKKLAEEFALLRSKCTELEQRGRSYDEALRNAQKSVATEQQAKKVADESLTKLRGDLLATESRLTDAVRTLDDERSMRRAAEESITKLERHCHDLLLRHAEERQAIEKTLCANREETAALQRSCTALKADCDSMRDLLAAREQEHRAQLDQRYSVDSPKLEQLLEAKVSSLVKKHSIELQHLDEKMAAQQNDYAALEDEFRLALHVEAERFNTLQDAYEKLSAESAQCRQALASATSKNEQSTRMIADMTQLIKEQKEKITKLSASRQEQAISHKEVQEKLQTQITALKKQMIETERLRKEATDLKTQIQGQHSIIVGLRTERELWSKELAQQGASLAADRGKLESRIEMLNAENGSLKAQLQQEADTVKIKAKIIEDQTETIAAQRQKLADMERALVDAERDAEARLQEADAAACGNQQLMARLEETAERLRTERDELIRHRDEIAAELEQSREAHRVLKNKWKEKSTAVAELETQVQRAKQTWEDGQRKLTEERDKAVLAADLALKKLRSADDSFRAQLEAKDAAQKEAMQRLEQHYQLRLSEADRRVAQVEDEMRELLSSEALTRKQTESRIKQAADAFAQLQRELLG